MPYAQWIFIGLTLTGLGMVMQESKTFTQVIGKSWPSFLTIALLYWGGFFDCLLRK